MKRKKQIGFTLIELLVVLVILGLLAGLVGPRVMKYVGGAKSDTARLQIEDIGAALDMFYLDNSRYPNSSEGLQALTTQPTGLDNWNGPYLKKKNVPNDPWGNPFNYVMPGQNGDYDLYTLGADDAHGGEKDNKDINSWE
ncbi:MAG: type II secretion system major pseudopilin GspG [Proteobacteria bacterium]|nr:type II secretion system protein GspG [Pseudomonadota bacterium]NOG58877.1 type II secretion system major pseudopilin GspG [Pseudomonadota bacterium]